MMELGDLTPVRRALAEIEEWETKVRARPLPETDPVAHALGTVREKLAEAIEAARDIEFELTPEQYAQVSGITRDALYKRWQRGRLPEARLRGGKLVVPVKEIARVPA